VADDDAVLEDEATDAEVLATLAAEMRCEFSSNSVIRFALAYTGVRVRVATLARSAAAGAAASYCGRRARCRYSPSSLESANDSRYASLLPGTPDVLRGDLRVRA
jgi:hypothetical protein